MKERLARPDIETSQGNRTWRQIIQFDPVAATGGGIGEPLVDLESERRNNRYFKVDVAGRGRTELPGVAQTPDRAVRNLQPVGNRIDAVGRCVVKEDTFAAIAEADGGVQLLRSSR